jgi:predicted alpha-1,2-mannosidase
MRLLSTIITLSIILSGCTSISEKGLTSYVNPFLGTATLWEPEDLGYVRTWEERTWGAEVFPGSSLPNAMVQLSPVTQFRSGAGYQYEDTVIFGFAHTNKGHWNLLHLPVLPVTGDVNPTDFASEYSHENESAHPGYYQVFLERYGINAELTSTLRSGYHKYSYNDGSDKKLIVDITRTNNRVRGWAIEKSGDYSFTGFQDAEGKIYFFAVSNYPIDEIEQVKNDQHEVSVVKFGNNGKNSPLELKIGFSFVSVENAKMNLEEEMIDKSFDQVRKEADNTWNKLLSNIEVSGGTEREKGIFYSTLYRSFLWPALRSDVNGDFTDERGEVVNEGFRYYTNPSFWDDYRNKLVLLGMVSPDVTTDVIKSIIDKGEKRGGYMPTFFHGDHASVFVSGSWLRGIKDFDLERAYALLLKNATVPGRGGRPYLDEYIEKGWIAEKDTTNVPFWDEYKAAVTKTVEYAYDDYATALVAKEIGDTENYELLMGRSMNYKNLFDPSTGFWRGKVDNGTKEGKWIEDFDPYYAYFAYLYRVSNDADWLVSLMKVVNSKYFGVLPDWRQPGAEFDNVGFLEKTLPYAGGMSFRNQPSDELTEKMIKMTYDRGFRGWYGIESSGRENILKSKELLMKHLPMK